jgi:single-strand DNA-binding protein
MSSNNGINKVILIGHIYKNGTPESQYESKKYFHFQFKTLESGSKKGEETSYVEYHEIKIPAHLLFDGNRFLDEGQLICIEGKLQTQKNIGTDGVKRYLTEIVVSRYDLLG